jgi:hypothetical protein
LNVPSDSEKSAFECALVAVSFFIGRRGAELLEPLSSPGRDAQDLASELAHADRNYRARALALELGRLSTSLEARRLS